MARTVDQQIAATQDKLARLQKKKRSLDARQKIIVGAIMIGAARQNKESASRLLQVLENYKMREVDKKAIAPLIEELRGQGKVSSKPEAVNTASNISPALRERLMERFELIKEHFNKSEPYTRRCMNMIARLRAEHPQLEAIAQPMVTEWVKAGYGQYSDYEYQHEWNTPIQRP